MNEITRFKGPSGDEMVIIPAAEYDRLVQAAEDASDVAAYDRAKAHLARGDEELLPAEFVDRILNGESRIKVWREYRGLTSTALAGAAGIGQGFLSQIETGKREGTLETLRKIAGVLGVALDDLAGSPEALTQAGARIVNYQRIEDLIQLKPGLTEAEIATELFGDKGYQQKVNADCRWLNNQCRVRRSGQGGPGDPFRYYTVEPEDLNDEP